MKKINENELKKIQLEILDFVAQFCEENKINYWLDSGTLIGAIRHKGYIPWDDDIDLGMLRKDYDKFMKLFNLKESNYVFYSVENNTKFNYPFGKVLDKRTVLYEPNKKYGEKLSVNIDIFVYDNIINDPKLIKKSYRIRNFYNLLNSVKRSPVATTRKSITNIVRFPSYYLLKLLPNAYFSKKIINNSKKYSKIKSKYIGNFTGYTKIICNKRVFRSFLKKEFEGKKYNVPIGYDEWLRCFYGDYMKLPPKNKRISTHKFEAYIK